METIEAKELLEEGEEELNGVEGSADIEMLNQEKESENWITNN